MNWKKTLLISGAIIVVAALLTSLIFLTEPRATRTGATKQTAMLVDIIEAQKGAFRPSVVAMGTVEPARDIVLSPRVSGEIIKRSQAFTPGGFVEKGELLLQIDPADYRNTLRQRESDLRQAVTDLKIEMGRQEVAQKDYQLLDDTLTAENKALVLREPQLNAARARVEAARAAVDQAKVELERTLIRAPFDAHILSRNVNVGSQVSPDDNLGRLVGMDTYWVSATVPLSKLRWLAFPESESEKGSDVRIRNRGAWPKDVYRTGHLYKMVGALEERTRMARVLVSVDDPLARRKGASDLPALMIGAFVEAHIKAREIEDVVRINRDYVRKNDTAWIMEDDKLRIRDLEIVFRDANYAYVRQGLNDKDRVVTTNLSTVVDGAKLRLKGSGSDSAGVATGAVQQNEQQATGSGN